MTTSVSVIIKNVSKYLVYILWQDPAPLLVHLFLLLFLISWLPSSGSCLLLQTVLSPVNNKSSNNPFHKILDYSFNEWHVPKHKTVLWIDLTESCIVLAPRGGAPGAAAPPSGPYWYCIKNYHATKDSLRSKMFAMATEGRTPLQSPGYYHDEKSLNQL